MRLLAIMPDIKGDSIQQVICTIENEIGFKIDLRSNFKQAINVVSDYDVIIVHQNVSVVPLVASDFEELSDANHKAIIIPLISEPIGSEIFSKLYALGIYNALNQVESSAHNIAKLIREPRDRGTAKAYYNIEKASEINTVADAILTDVQLKRVISFLDAAGSNIEEVFQNSLVGLSNQQKLYLIANLPESVKEKLSDSEVYINYARVLKNNEPIESKTIYIEQVVNKEKVVEKTEILKAVIKNSKLVTVVGNSELCTELSYANAVHTNSDVLLIDLETTVPDLHKILGMKETVNQGITIGDVYTNSSFLQAYELASSNSLNYEMLRNIAVRFQKTNLSVLTGNDNFLMNESFNIKTIQSIIDLALMTYGTVYINIPNDIYNMAFLMLVRRPDNQIIISFNGGAIDLRNKMSLMELLRKAQNLSLKNIKYLAFEYTSNHLEEGNIKKNTDGLYIGKISHDVKRVIARNDFSANYVTAMNKHIDSEYVLILNRLGIEVKETLGKKIKRILSRGGTA